MENQKSKPGQWEWENPVSNIDHKLVEMVNRIPSKNEANRERYGKVDLSKRFDKSKEKQCKEKQRQ